jgi:hypothetical protein
MRVSPSAPRRSLLPVCRPLGVILLQPRIVQGFNGFLDVGRVVSREAEILPPPVRLKLFKSALLSCCVTIASEQQPEWRLGERGDVQNRRRCFRRITRLFPVIASLEADRSADGGVVLRAAFTQFGGGTGEVCTKAARLVCSASNCSVLFPHNLRLAHRHCRKI